MMRVQNHCKRKNNICSKAENKMFVWFYPRCNAQRNANFLGEQEIECYSMACRDHTSKPLCLVMKSTRIVVARFLKNTAQFHYAFGRRDRLRPSYYAFRTDQNGAVAPSCGQQVLANIAIRLGELFSGTTILSNQNRSNRPA